jgi:hypothetical protein
MFPPFEEDRMPEPHIRYLSFSGETFRELRARITGASDAAIFRVHGPFNEHATIEVVEPGQDAAARLKPLNEAHPCPPACG